MIDTRLFVPPILEVLFRKIRAAIRHKYVIGNYTLAVPPHMALPSLQKKHRLYDRFLPVLAKHIDGAGLIVDVGANVGDTTIAILQECKNPILSIEPSDSFHSFLKKNIATLPVEQNARIKIIKKMVGTGSFMGSLTHSMMGTATLHVETNSKSTTHTPLDELVDDGDNIVLLKTDTDGFDFDVICSAYKILKHSEPILFWENEVSEDFQLEGYTKMYEVLESNGYQYIYIFDNYGNLMTQESHFATLRNITSYLYTMKKNKQTRTFYYTDVLACTTKNLNQVKAAIKEYKKDWITR